MIKFRAHPTVSCIRSGHYVAWTGNYLQANSLLLMPDCRRVSKMPFSSVGGGYTPKAVSLSTKVNLINLLFQSKLGAKNGGEGVPSRTNTIHIVDPHFSVSFLGQVYTLFIYTRANIFLTLTPSLRYPVARGSVKVNYRPQT